MDTWILMLANICITIGYVGMQLCKSIWIFGKKLKDPNFKEQKGQSKVQKMQNKAKKKQLKADTCETTEIKQSTLKIQIESQSDTNS